PTRSVNARTNEGGASSKRELAETPFGAGQGGITASLPRMAVAVMNTIAMAAHPMATIPTGVLLILRLPPSACARRHEDFTFIVPRKRQRGTRDLAPDGWLSDRKSTPSVLLAVTHKLVEIFRTHAS